jgi:ribosomal protein S18 acetylase RimI-like enzyme
MRKAENFDKAVVIEILTEAFNENKSVNYVVKQDADRKDRIRKLMEYSFNLCNQFGEVWISEDKEACVLLLHPDKKRFTIASTLWDVNLAFSVIGLSRVKAVLDRESKIKLNHPATPFSYLWFIGVNPLKQGKGIGSDLLTKTIEICEKEKRPIYLETSVERNLKWYQSFGFEIFKTLDLSYKLYLLRRPVNGSK